MTYTRTLPRWTSYSDVLAVQDFQSLLQGFDLLLAARNPVLIADIGIDTRWLELVEVGKGRIQLLLCAFQILLVHLEGGLILILPARLVLNRGRFSLLVNFGVAHEGVVLALRSRLRGGGLRFQSCEIRLDNFHHADNTSIVISHALVRLVEDWGCISWLLHECCRLAGLLVEFLEHGQGLSYCSLCDLCILDGLSILCLLLLAELGGL